LNVVEKNEAEMFSRRKAFSILGLTALSLVMSPTVLTVSDAEAQQPSTTTGQTPQAGTPQTGTERRQERRGERTEQRQERRTGRTERRKKRRTGRTERRKKRHTGRTERQKKRGETTPPTSRTPQ
jgi:hypothetical protein